MWIDAGNELTPPKSTERMAANARFVVTTVSLVAVVITGFGLVGADKLGDSTWARVLAVAAVTVSVLSVAISLDFLRQRTHKVNTANIDEVRGWFTDQLSRGWEVSVAGVLLLAAVVLSALAALLAAMSDAPVHRPTVIVELHAVDGSSLRTTSGSITCSGCAAQEAFRIAVVTRPPATTAGQQLCLRATAQTDADGKLQVSIPQCPVPAGAVVLVYINDVIAGTVDAR